MPHLTLEYSNNMGEPFDIPLLFERMARTLLDYPPIRIEDIKCRAIGYDQFRVGVGKPDSAFIHLSVDIMVGRTPDQRKTLSQAMLVLLEEAFHDVFTSQPCDITVNIREIDRDSYGKMTNFQAEE
jgi:5-carboxymethyl-2-hydroxymuconate isomerase